MIVRFKKELPEYVQNKPDLNLGNEFYYTSFEKLNTTRQLGMAPGPISFLAILDYAKHYDLDFEETEDLAYVIGEVDQFFLSLIEDKSTNEK